MKSYLTTTALFILVLTSNVFCQPFDIQGHRGCRGLMPENSIPGFMKAIDLGVTTIEMDVVVSADGKIVVSHDPYISSDFCLNEVGLAISKKKEKDIIIFQMDYEDVKLFDCGILGNPEFPEQQKISTYKPLLCDVIRACEAYVTKTNKADIKYNIELKSDPAGDHVLQPEPELFTRLVYNGIKDLVPADRITIQSFDPRILQFWKMKYPDYHISFLTGASKSPQKVEEELGFRPDIYSPHYRQLNQKDIDEWHGLSVKVIPWTVNDVDEMRKLKDFGVDGLITDYPNRYFQSLSEK